MTHNIVAEFSSSVWKESEAERATSLNFFIGDFKVYPVINGSIFNEEYNETLDSATILLSQVQKEDRLSNIKPYDYVRIYDTSTYNSITGKYGFDKLYLVDNFDEEEKNIKEHLFGYTINLMSETKWLEKIQCPNLAITHEVTKNGRITKKTIWQHIKQYMELYVPKIKFSSGNFWSYEPLLKMNILYANGVSTIPFNISDFTYQGDEYEISIESSELDVNIDVGSIKNISFSISSTPTLLWAPGNYTKVTLDEQNRKFIFHGLVQDFPVSSLTASEEFEEQDFTQQGDDYEIYITVAQLGSDTLSSPVTIDNFTVDSTLIWGVSEITYDSANKQIVFHGVTNQRGHGTINVNYEAKKVNGTINVNYQYVDYEHDEFYKRFNASCADLAFTTPTLRQLLTTLMIQVGCIPVIHNRTLGFLDFQKSMQVFGGSKGYSINNTVNFIRRGLSSDSYVNTLINISQNVLDSQNQVVCEALGFRDKSSALLKQEENLFLETKFPIYKVNRFDINAYVKCDVDINNIMQSGEVGTQNTYWRWSITFSKIINKINIDFGISYEELDDYELGLYIKGKVFCFKSGYEDYQVCDIEDVFYGSTFQPGTDGKYSFDLTDLTYDTFYFYGYIAFFDPEEVLQGYAYDVFVCTFAGNQELLTLYSENITPLLVENSIRQNLSNDFLLMEGETSQLNATIQTLSKYIYGTVGYDIGSTKISGFSTVYNVGSSTVLGWLNKEYTYIENIWSFLITHYEGSIAHAVQEEYCNFPNISNMRYVFDTDTFEPILDTGTQVTSTKSIDFNSVTPYNPMKHSGDSYRVFSSDINFSYLWFNIRYQPLNSFNLAYVKNKESVDIPIAQYDSNASGLTDFDRLSINEQERVDRIGNETLSINQRTDDFEDVQTFENGPLYFMDDTNRSGSVGAEDNGVKYVIFKRSFTINNNCFNASYVGSKDAILKNYFTSIRTKYRAYQYVDYNNSVLRKERDTFFVRISENDWYNGDDKVFFGQFNLQSLTIQNHRKISLLGSWLATKTNAVAYDKSNQNSVKYTILADNNTKTKNDASVIANRNGFGIIYEEFDNVGSGTYITNESFNQAYTYRKSVFLGGVPQTWQIWAEDYNKSHLVVYSSYLNIANTFDSYIDASSVSSSEIEASMEKILNLPILNLAFIDIGHSSKVVFSIVQDNTTCYNDLEMRKRLFYKDYAERINHSVQFIYYTDSENILWTENFFKLNDISGNVDFSRIDIISLQDKAFELDDAEYRTNDFNPILVNGDIVSFHNGENENTAPFIQVNWGLIPNISQFKVVATAGYGYRYDVLAFKKGNETIQKFFVTLNDTKTDYVLAEKNGILYRRYVVSKNTLSRTVEDNPDIYDVEE